MVLQTYRFRWQIELVFKRMKSLLDLDEMTAKAPELCRAFLFGKLILYVLAEQLSRPGAAFSPWGYGVPREAASRANLEAGPDALRGTTRRNRARGEPAEVNGTGGEAARNAQRTDEKAGVTGDGCVRSE